MGQIKRAIIVFFIIGIIGSIALIMNKKVNYMVYMDENIVGCVESKAEFKNLYKDIIRNLEERYSLVNEITHNIEYKVIKRGRYDVDIEDDVKTEVLNNLTDKVSVKEMYINNQLIGYVKDEAEGHKLLQNVGQMYCENIASEEIEISNVSINCNSKYIDKEVEVNKIKSLEEMKNEIYENNSRCNYIDIEVKYFQDVQENIIAPKVIKSDENLYIGDSRRYEGKDGKRNIKKSITLLNGVNKKEDIIESYTVEEPIDEIIYAGSKNPIDENIAFLSIPSRGGITSNYGSRWGETHHGLDIAGKIGEPIKVAASGKVENTSYDNIYGNKIVVNHGGGITTIYGHCSEVLVNVGDNIKQGDTIGKIGTTGRSTGPHLHFELRENNIAINPLGYIK